MKKSIKFPSTQIAVVLEKRKGESIEEMLRRMRTSKEPIKADARIDYTERKDGVLAQYDIRTDRFEYAMMAADRVHMSKMAQRMSEDGYIQDNNGNWIQKTTENTNQE